MKFEHREIPEGINVTDVHPLKELAVLLTGAAILIVAVVYILGLSAGFLAPYIPFATEQRLVASASYAIEPHTDTDAERYLQQVTDRVVKVMDLPEEIDITLHYSAGDTVNAFATLGGNVVVFRGLLAKLPNENALAMLLAHEIAHVKHRDPIVSLTRGVTISTALGVLLGFSDLDLMGEAGVYTMLHFSRVMEQKADTEALQAVYKLYGHTQGATDLFQVIHDWHQRSGSGEGVEFMQSHPLDQNRIKNLNALASSNEWPQAGGITALPQSFLDGLKQSSNDIQDE
ncbi:M48 family metallopeptidase [Amphritea pacifica]|uniref:M48 family metallopeptidase n=1 Tax=Amphritea pacifica TaxID=2811233 RepID=A0ABS2WC52_9GAMM|nr:M48 family metallopeptidase [Amphritea pacifica]MBN0989296.1 M48 family metallopeptidase [Amphritea pacifica]MBN1008851.1 M48 family metallopeptidase [Amphritea pacifica]